ncbi:hypothetical protein ACQJBY_043476 [Aegilops geniculata]
MVRPLVRTEITQVISRRAWFDATKLTTDVLNLYKGAVENLLERSVYIQLLDGSVVLLDEGAKALVLSTLHEMSGNALRCLSFAYKEDLAEFATYDGEEHPAHKYLLDPAYYSSIESISDILWFCWSKESSTRRSPQSN